MDWQTEFVNQSLGNLLRCLIGEHPRNWESIFLLAEFASSLSRTFKASPFEVVYGIKLLSVLDLAPLSLSKKENVRAKKKKRRKFMQSVHAQVKARIEHSNANYKAAADIHRWRLNFMEGDLVWVILTKERCPHGFYSMLGARKVGSCKVLTKINDNAYTVQLPSSFKCF